MNAYHRRRQVRELKQKSIRNAKILLRLMHQDALMTRYEDACFAVYGYRPEMSVSIGWYRARFNKGTTKYFREVDLVIATRVLEAKKEVQNASYENV